MFFEMYIFFTKKKKNIFFLKNIKIKKDFQIFWKIFWIFKSWMDYWKSNGKKKKKKVFHSIKNFILVKNLMFKKGCWNYFGMQSFVKRKAFDFKSQIHFVSINKRRNNNCSSKNKILNFEMYFCLFVCLYMFVARRNCWSKTKCWISITW